MAHLARRGSLDVLDEGEGGRLAMSGDELEEALAAELVGGDLGTDVGEVLGDGSAGERARGEERGEALSSGRPAATRRRGTMMTPSSPRVRPKGGMEPGATPPISAWWARLPTKKRSSPEGENRG